MSRTITFLCPDASHRLPDALDCGRSCGVRAREFVGRRPFVGLLLGPKQVELNQDSPVAHQRIWGSTRGDERPVEGRTGHRESLLEPRPVKGHSSTLVGIPISPIRQRIGK